MISIYIRVDDTTNVGVCCGFRGSYRHFLYLVQIFLLVAKLCSYIRSNQIHFNCTEFFQFLLIENIAWNIFQFFSIFRPVLPRFHGSNPQQCQIALTICVSNKPKNECYASIMLSEFLILISINFFPLIN